MNYGDKEAFLRQIQEYLSREDLHDKTEDQSSGEYAMLYILIKRRSPENTIVAAANKEGGVFLFYPFDENEEFSEPWDFDADRLLFEMLGEGYEILDMTMCSTSQSGHTL